jgi:hypothetical protein
VENAYPQGRALIHPFAGSSCMAETGHGQLRKTVSYPRRYYCGNPAAAPEGTTSAKTFLRAPPDRERDLPAAPVGLGIAELWPGQGHAWVPVGGPLGPRLHRSARRTSQRLGDAGCPLVEWARPPCNPGGAATRKSLSRVTAQPAAASAEATASSC